MRVILVEDKHDTYVIEFEPASILNLLAGRVEQGWYHGDRDEDTAKQILKVGNDAAAWAFLVGRRNHEYEWVELQEVRQ